MTHNVDHLTHKVEYVTHKVEHLKQFIILLLLQVDSYLYQPRASKDFQDGVEYEDYRGEANVHLRLRHECFQKAQEAYRRGLKQLAGYYSQQVSSCHTGDLYRGWLLEMIESLHLSCMRNRPMFIIDPENWINDVDHISDNLAHFCNVFIQEESDLD